MPQPLNILVIEDDADDIEFLSEAFRENHLQVNMETLTRGDLINKYLESNKPLPQLIVMDLNLPKLHGRDVLCIIRENPRFKTVPVAVLTTSSLVEDVSFCIDHGADKFITKPSSPDDYALLARQLEAMARSPRRN